MTAAIARSASTDEFGSWGGLQDPSTMSVRELKQTATQLGIAVQGMEKSELVDILTRRLTPDERAVGSKEPNSAPVKESSKRRPRPPPPPPPPPTWSRSGLEKKTNK
jgi:hypothetical protein